LVRCLQQITSNTAALLCCDIGASILKTERHVVAGACSWPRHITPCKRLYRCLLMNCAVCHNRAQPKPGLLLSRPPQPLETI
jgi:flavorubredoxin